MDGEKDCLHCHDPKKPITSGEMAAIEKKAEALGIPLELLMENAGAAVARLVLEKFPNARRVVVFCGTGNNGGDGLVAARHLAGLVGFRVRVVMVGSPAKIKQKEALLNWRIANKLRKSLKISGFRKTMQVRADVVVDAMLGTGVHGLLREPILSAVRLINNSGSRNVAVVAVDTPTGLDPSTGLVAGRGGEAVKAAYTVTFHRMKKGFLKGQSRKYTGKVIIAEIGVPKEADVF